MSFKKETIEVVLEEMGHTGQLLHCPDECDADELFNSLLLFSVTIDVDKEDLINKLKEKQSVWRGVVIDEVDEVEVEEKVADKE